MNAEILNNVKAKREVVETRFESMVAQATRLNKNYITSKKFFFEVVANHFENMSTVMTNKCLKSINVFNAEFFKAIEKAEYACAKPERNNNRQYFA
jgi:hypothetical protein